MNRMPAKKTPFLLCSGIASALAISGCSDQSKDNPEEFVSEACLISTIPPQVIEETESNEPYYTSDPITDAVSLSNGIRFNNSDRLTGSIPLIGSPLGGSFEMSTEISVTDTAQVSIDLTPSSLPDGKRIGAVFVKVNGTNEYFAIDIQEGATQAAADQAAADAAAAQSAADAAPDDTRLAAAAEASAAAAAAVQALADAGGISIVLNGPRTLDPLQELIQESISGRSFPITVRAVLFDEGTPTPGDLTDFVENDATLWLGTAETPSLITEFTGAGAIKFTLTWDQAVDLDMWVFEPDGHRIYYADRNSSQGDGFLDVDDTSGFGPENIFFETDIPEGSYNVQVNYFSGSPVTNYTVTVAACGDVLSFTGFLVESGGSAGDVADVYTFDYFPGCTLSNRSAGPVEPYDPGIFEQSAICDPVRNKDAVDANSGG